jgi:flagella basal body P-ring formation protein FlgA
MSVVIMKGLACVALFALAASVSHGATLPEAVSLAKGELAAELARRRPQVTHWSIEPLPSRGRLAGGNVEHVSETKVVRLGARSAVRLAWTTAGKKFVHTAWFSVSGMQPVMTATSALKAGDMLDGLVYASAERDVVGIACTPITERAALTGLRTTRSLSAGDPICEERVEPRPPVARGDEVTVRSVAGPVTIIAKGIAQQDGKLGEVLRIKNPQNRELYLAAVAGDREVVVHE